MKAAHQWHAMRRIFMRAVMTDCTIHICVRYANMHRTVDYRFGHSLMVRMTISRRCGCCGSRRYDLEHE